MNSSQKLRNMCFTINNPDVDSDKARLEALPVAYCVGYAEVGDSGTPHIQGYCEFTKQVKFSAIVGALEGRAHIEPRRGSRAQAVDYCRKGEQPHAEWSERGTAGPAYGLNAKKLFEWGVAKEQGKRSDLDGVVADLVCGKRLSEIAEANPIQFIKFSKGIQAYHSAVEKPRDKHTPLEVEVYYGPTGTGKTWQALLQSDPENVFKYSITCATWFDGYDGHHTVVFDEFRGQLPFGMFLQLTDVYPLKVQVKGGFREWKPNKIIITSPVHPAQWYDPAVLAKKEGSIDQLKRRITKITYFPAANKDNHGAAQYIDKTDVDWPSASDQPAFDFGPQFS